MSVQRITDALGYTVGFQARAHLADNRYLSRYFATGKHGHRRARVLAQEADPKLQASARRLKRRLGHETR